MRKLNKTRALKYMAKHTPDLFVRRVDRQDVLFREGPVLENLIKPWAEMMKIKHGPDVLVDIEVFTEIDHDRIKVVGTVRP